MIFIRSLGRLASVRTASTTSTPSAAPASQATTASATDINNLINIEDSCFDRLKQILQRPNEEFLRIQVETGGCSGFSYSFHIEDNTKISAHEDLVFARDHYRVVVSKDILPYMKGSSIEFSESLIKSSFQITNPVAETKCSCGSSFSVDLGKLGKS